MTDSKDATELLTTEECKAIRQRIALATTREDDPLVLCVPATIGGQPVRLSPDTVKRMERRFRVMLQAPADLVRAITTIDAMRDALYMALWGLSCGKPDPGCKEVLTATDWKIITDEVRQVLWASDEDVKAEGGGG